MGYLIAGILIAMISIVFALRYKRILEKRFRISHQEILDKLSIYQKVYDYMEEAVFIIRVAENGDFIIESFNASQAKYPGLDSSSLLGKTTKEAFPPEIAADLNNHYQKCVISKKPYTYTEEVALKQSSEISKTTLYPFLGKQGQVEKLLGFSIQITQEKKYEKALSEAEKDLKLLVSNLPGAVFRCLLDEDRMMVYVSQEVSSVTGRSSESFLHNNLQSFFSIIYPEDREKIDRTVYGSLKNKNGYIVEYRIVLPDGTLRWVSERGKIMFNQLDEPLWIDGFLFNINEKHEALEALEANLKFQQALLETLPVPLYYKDEKGVFLGCNSAYEKFLKIPKNELIGKTVYDIFHPEIAELYTNQDHLLLKNGGIQVYEADLISTDKIIHRVLFHKTVFYHLNQEVAGIIGVILDITEQRKIEKELRLSEKKYREFLDFLPQFVFECDLKGMLTYSSPSTIKGFGYTQEEFDSGINIMQTISSSEFARARKNMQEILEGKKSLGHEYTMLKKDKTTFPGMLYSVRIMEDGIPSGMRGIIIDVSDQKVVEEMARAKEIAERSNKAKSEFLANMSHEIRTPMTAVIGMTEYLISFTDLSDEQKEYLQIIKNSSYALVDLINDILDLSKIEAGKMELRETEFDLPAFIEQVAGNLKVNASMKHIRLDYEIGNGVYQYVIGDMGRIRQILVNLLGNAIKFTEKGGVKLRVMCEKQEGQTLWIEFGVQDTGIGIPKNKLEYIFETFTQVDSSATRRHGGTGLGLSICRKLATLLGGKIEVSSEEGKGSVFTFTIPLKITPYSNIKKIIPNQNLRIIESAHKKETKGCVLLVEDNEFNSQIIKGLLEKSGYRVFEVQNGKDALSVFDEKKPELILMDIQMSEMDGFQTAKKIREKDNGKAIPIIALSAYLKIEAQIMKESGITDYLSKPFEFSSLLRLLEKYFSQKN